MNAASVDELVWRLHKRVLRGPEAEHYATTLTGYLKPFADTDIPDHKLDDMIPNRKDVLIALADLYKSHTGGIVRTAYEATTEYGRYNRATFLILGITGYALAMVQTPLQTALAIGSTLFTAASVAAHTYLRIKRRKIRCLLQTTLDDKITLKSSVARQKDKLLYSIESPQPNSF